MRSEYQYITLKERPELAETAAEWFHQKWGVPKEAYLDCIRAYLSGETDYSWYLCLRGDLSRSNASTSLRMMKSRRDLKSRTSGIRQKTPILVKLQIPVTEETTKTVI